jgi:mono/diheme cytochrome c family protein
MKGISLVGAILLLSLGLAARSQEQTPGTQQKKTIKEVPIKPTAATSGEEMYGEYCAVCHGKAGKGDGPAAAALKQPPADLSALAKGNNGKFPTERVAAALRFGTETPAHGSKDMPVWGPLLGSLQGKTANSDAAIQLRIANLTKYIETLQSK